MPGALGPELNELPDSSENEIAGPGTLVILRSQSPVFSTGNRGLLIQLMAENIVPQFRWHRSSERQ